MAETNINEKKAKLKANMMLVFMLVSNGLLLLSANGVLPNAYQCNSFALNVSTYGIFSLLYFPIWTGYG